MKKMVLFFALIGSGAHVMASIPPIKTPAARRGLTETVSLLSSLLATIPVTVMSDGFKSAREQKAVRLTAVFSVAALTAYVLYKKYYPVTERCQECKKTTELCHE